MTEQELREKIVKIALNTSWTDMFGDHYSIGESAANAIADTLIAAGIGDVKEVEMAANRYEMLYKMQSRDMVLAERKAYKSEHRAEVAEMALNKAVELAYEYRTEADILSCSSCPMFHIFDSCKERGLYKDCSKRWKEELIKQAEKELAEEGKDENKTD